MRRTFIAIETKFNEAGNEHLKNIKDELLEEKIRWVDNSNFHLTLFFIGDTSEQLIQEIRSELNISLSGYKAFKLSCYDFGVFRNIKTPRALWFGFKESKELYGLKQIIDESLNRLGIEIIGKEFKPHLTIGRTKYISDRDTLKELIDKNKDTKIQDFFINEVVFYESTLTSGGAIYKAIDRFKLDVSSF